MSISETVIQAPIDNPVVDALLNRRSCRNFQSRALPRRELQTIVLCGQHAATAKAREPWHILVIQQAALLEEIAATTRLGMRESGIEEVMKFAENPDFHCFYHAPALVIVSGDGSRYADVDCANVVQNMCVAAHSLDIGSCYNGFFRFAFKSSRGSELQQRLKIPQGFEPLLSVALGFPDGLVRGYGQRTDEKVTWLV